MGRLLVAALLFGLIVVLAYFSVLYWSQSTNNAANIKVDYINGYAHQNCNFPNRGVIGTLEVLSSTRVLLISGCLEVAILDSPWTTHKSVTHNLKNFIDADSILKFSSVSPDETLYLSYISNVLDCVYVNVIRASISDVQTSHSIMFEPFYRTTGCVSDPRELHAAGSKIYAHETAIFVSTGDFLKSNSYAQDVTKEFGKILKIDTDETVHVLSMGHRNPQGLWLYDADHLIETEHGPRGGDEINLIPLHGGTHNFGWPTVSYGNHYNGTLIPSQHYPDYIPAVAFIPFDIVESNGIGDIKSISSKLFAIASLNGKRLYVLDLRDGIPRMQYVWINYRIRNIAVIDECNIMLLTERSDDYFGGPLATLNICGTGSIFERGF